MTRTHVVAVLFFASTLVATQVPATAENPIHVKRLRDTRSCPGCALADADLAGLQAEMGDLRNADLRRANLYKATLRGADLTGASLVGASLAGADLTGARGANLTGAVTNATTRCPGGAHGPC